MIYQITSKQAFPKFKGSLTNMYHVPLGREYFNGNGLNFKVNAQDDIKESSHVHYMADGIILLNGKEVKPISYFHGHGAHSAILTKGKHSFLSCYRALVKDKIGVNCTILKEETVKADSHIIDHFSTPNCHVSVTNKGELFIYWSREQKVSKHDITQDGNGEIRSSTFKTYQGNILMVFLDEQDVIYFKRHNMYNSATGLDSIGSPLRNKYPDEHKNPEQKTAGDYCPKSVKFFLSDNPELVILNSCATKDRRFIKYLVTNKREFAGNFFIRKIELMHPHLKMCPDRENYFVVGNRTHNNIEDLGLRELRVTKIIDILCVGHGAIGIFATAKVGKNLELKTIGITYYTGKMRDADNRVHSTFVIEGKFVRATASEGEGLVFYNIYTQEKKEAFFKVVDLKGPRIFFKSMEREVAYETEIQAWNGNMNENFGVLVEFERLREEARVSCLHKVFEIEEGKTYNVENISLWHGPLWSYRTVGSSATITPRIGEPKLMIINPKEDGVVQAEAVSYARGRIFTLVQHKDYTKIIVTPAKHGSNKTILDMKYRCHGLKVVDDYRPGHDKKAVGLTNCFIEHNPHMTFLSINFASGKAVLEKYDYAGKWPYESTQFELAYLSREHVGPKPSNSSGSPGSSNSSSGSPKSSDSSPISSNSSNKLRRRYLMEDEDNAPQRRILAADKNDFLAVMVHKRNKTLMFKWFTTASTGTGQVTFNDFFKEQNGKFKI